MVTPHFPPKVTGMSTVVSELINKLAERGFTLHLLTFSQVRQDISHKGRLFFYAVTKHDMDVAMKRVNSNDYFAWVVRSGSPSVHFFLASIRLAKKIVDKHNPDLVHIHTSLDDYVAAYLGFKLKESFPDVPVILTIHGGGLVPKPEENSIRRDLLARFERITVVSGMLKGKLVKIGVPSCKVEVIPNGVDTNRFHPYLDDFEIRLRHGIRKGDPLILYAGRLDPGKGIQYLIAAFSHLLNEVPKARLLLVGDGYLSGFIKEIASARNLERSVFVEDSVDQDSMPKVFSAADIVVLPSTKEEACPMVLLEAMASGKPVIATRVGGVPEIIDDGENGILVTPSNVKDLTDAMFKTIESKNLAKTLAKNGREKAEKEHSLEYVAREYRSLYASLSA